MSFISVQFVIFFALVTSLYFALPHRFRWILLLLFSCIFYMAFIPKYILVLFAAIIIDYLAGLALAKYKDHKLRKAILIISIISTCAILFVFKYYNFFITNILDIAMFLDWNLPIKTLEIILPIGLSFHTFQSLSYVIEVYRKKQKAEKHFGIYALYVMFYPQLMAGPIERPQQLLHQFYEKHYFEYERVVSGLRLILWGAFQKVIIADNLALVVNKAFEAPNLNPGYPLLIASVFFAIQIFCDFAGYCNIAIGAARVMGFDLVRNFNRPYFSKSITEFWTRWHISLSSWLRDYIYIPLGGNRVAQPRFFFNIMLTFLISGLWHGSNWTFVFWGALNGMAIILESLTKDLRDRLMPYKLMQVIFTFSLICCGWVFFRAKSITEAWFILTHLFSDINQYPAFFKSIDLGAFINFLISRETFFGIQGWSLVLALLCTVGMFSVQLLERRNSINELFSRQTPTIRWLIYYLAIFLLYVYGVTNQQQFIYFQF